MGIGLDPAAARREATWAVRQVLPKLDWSEATAESRVALGSYVQRSRMGRCRAKRPRAESGKDTQFAVQR